MFSQRIKLNLQADLSLSWQKYFVSDPMNFFKEFVISWSIPTKVYRVKPSQYQWTIVFNFVHLQFWNILLSVSTSTFLYRVHYLSNTFSKVQKKCVASQDHIDREMKVVFNHSIWQVGAWNVYLQFIKLLNSISYGVLEKTKRKCIVCKHLTYDEITRYLEWDILSLILY